MLEKHDLVREHYERFPYPDYPFYFRGRRSELKRLDVRSWHLRRPAADILVAGCGTVAAFMFGQANPKCRILGLDLSEKSLRKSRFRCWLWGVHNVEYRVGDLLQIQESFDVIDAYGVIHHTVDPEKSLQHLVSCLRPGGVIRLMLYSKKARDEYEKIRSELLKEGRASFEGAQAYLSEKSIRPFGELRTRSGLADALIHPLVKTYSSEEVESLVQKVGGVELIQMNELGNFVLFLRKSK